jgi:MoaA/NifB/PqqE/SkfB family radical SAM enzyme
MMPPFSLRMPESARAVARELASWPLNPPPGDDGALRELHLEVTHRCDLRCRMCHHWRLKQGGHEITPAQLEGLLAASRLLAGVKTAVLTGGEPLLRPDLPELAAVILRKFPGVSLGVLTHLSNTRLLLDRVGKIHKLGPAKLWLGSSLDGLGAAHDGVRGSRGAYARAMKSLKAVREAFPGLEVAFNFTLLPSNAGQLFRAYRAAKELGAWFGAQKVVNHTGFEAETYAWSPRALKTALTQVDGVITDICAEHKAFEKLMTGKEGETPWLWASLVYWVRLREYLAAPARLLGGCYSGRRYAMLSPEGDLFFCPVRKHRTLGNVLQDGFDAVWNGPKAKAERKLIAAGRCHCWLHCTANPVIEGAVNARFSGVKA